VRLRFVIPVAIAGLCLAGCGQAQRPSAGTASTAPVALRAAPAGQPLGGQAHPQVVEPVAGAAGSPQGGGSGVVSVGGSGGALPQPVSDAEIRHELAASGVPAGDRAAITPNGLAIAPLGAPQVVQTVIQAGNQIAHLPYRFGGGHGTFTDNAYDCSGSISFAFAVAGILNRTVTSGELMNWGDPGPGKWITIMANGTHTYMYVAGVRFDTGGLAVTGSRWQAGARSYAGFAVRHPAGL
jgi:cell wall-associated NlpC family hydrolase